MEFDDNGTAIPGTYPISTVHLGMWGEGDKPMPTVTSAVCDVCGGWASEVWVRAYPTTADDSLTDVRVSRRVVTVVYACPEHSGEVVDALTDDDGGATNAYDPDDLAAAVDRANRQQHEGLRP